MGLGQILMPVRAWWFLQIAKNATIPADVGQYLVTLRDRNQLALDENERKRQVIIDKRAAEGKSMSTEAALRSVLRLRETYDGPDREKYVSELDQFIDNFRKNHGAQIPVDEAYAILKDIEARLGRVE